MKIGIFDPYLDDNGGGERYMVTVATCLSKNHSVDIFWDEEDDLYAIGKRFGLDVSRLNLVENIFSANYPKLDKYKKTKKYDAIIVLSDGSIPLLFSKKTYLHMQQPIEHSLNVREKLKLKKVNKLIVNSKFTKNFIESKYNQKCELLYPPVSLIKSEIKENTILHVGRFRVMNVKTEDYKKQQFMIDTFKEMVDDGLSGWRFLLAVSLNDEKDARFLKMKESAKNYPIDFLINSEKDDLWRKAGRAKIYWHATGFGEDLVKYPHLAEHFGISTAEAMGAGIVPVVISAGGQKEIVEEGVSGLLWETKDEFKKKTLRLISDKKELDRLSKKAVLKAVEYSDESFCKNVNRIINV